MLKSIIEMKRLHLSMEEQQMKSRKENRKIFMLDIIYINTVINKLILKFICYKLESL